MSSMDFQIVSNFWKFVYAIQHCIAKYPMDSYARHNCTTFDESANSRWRLVAVLIFLEIAILIHNCWRLHAELNKIKSAFNISSRSKFMAIIWIRQNGDWRPSWISAIKGTLETLAMNFRILQHFLKALYATQYCTTKILTNSFFHIMTKFWRDYDEYANSRLQLTAIFKFSTCFIHLLLSAIAS